MSSVTKDSVLKTYRNIYRVMRKTKELSGSQEAMTFIQKEFRLNKTNEDSFKKAKLFENYITSLKEYSELIQMYKVGRYEPTLHELLKQSAAKVGVSMTPKDPSRKPSVPEWVDE
ncbi:hypothetical protein ABK040_004754 [Willaertia magna]